MSPKVNEVLKFQNLLSALPVRVRNFRSKKSIGIRRSYQYQTPCNFFWSATNPRGTDFLVWFTDCGLDLQLGITPMHAIRTLLWYHEVVVHIIFYLGYDFLNPESKLSDSNLRIYRLQVVSLQIASVNLTTWILDNKKSITVPDFFAERIISCSDAAIWFLWPYLTKTRVLIDFHPFFERFSAQSLEKLFMERLRKYFQN